MTKEIQVLVTGVGGGGIGEQVMFALRTAETPYRIIGTDMDQYSLGLHSADKGYVVPRSTDESYITRMIEICEREGVKALIPGSEAELIKISESREVFRDHNILLLINDSTVIDLCLNKWDTYLFLKDNGFNAPESYLPTLIEDPKPSITFPVIIKPYVGTGGSRFVFIAQTNEELEFFLGYLRRNNVKPMVQRYVGSGESEFTVGVLTSFEGDLMGSIALKRNISGRLSTLYKIKNYQHASEPIHVSTGISQGLIDSFPNVRKSIEKVAMKLGSKGPINIQCRVVGDKCFIFEINPRFSGTESLRALAGYNAPDALIRKYVLGKEIDMLGFRGGRGLRGLNNYFMEEKTK